MLVIGPKEAESGSVAVRERKAGDQGAMTIEAFAEKLAAENVPATAG